jgi:hypothetical protein
LDEHRLFFRELSKAEFPVIVPLPRGADTAERQVLLRQMHQRIVDRYTAGDRPGQDPVPCRTIGAKPVERERPVATVHVGQGVGQCVVGDDRQDGTENLLLHDLHRVVNVE